MSCNNLKDMVQEVQQNTTVTMKLADLIEIQAELEDAEALRHDYDCLVNHVLKANFIECLILDPFDPEILDPQSVKFPFEVSKLVAMNIPIESALLFIGNWIEEQAEQMSLNMAFDDVDLVLA